MRPTTFLPAAKCFHSGEALHVNFLLNEGFPACQGHVTSCHQVELELHKAVTLAKNNFLLMQLFQMSVLNSPVNQHQVVRAPQVAGAGRGGVGLRLAETLGAPWRHIPFTHHQNLTCSPYLALLKSPGKCRRGSLEMMETAVSRLNLRQLWPTTRRR